uniref:Uncharacterized protein n=1 Tax=Glossina morsitans morsitans TaxID=37546 RepID=A0A1B0G9Y0_GLOMM
MVLIGIINSLVEAQPVACFGFLQICGVAVLRHLPFGRADLDGVGKCRAVQSFFVQFLREAEEKEFRPEECCGEIVNQEITSSDDEVVVTKGGQKAGSLKGGVSKRNHSLSDMSDSDTEVELNMRRSDSMPTVSACCSGTVKSHKAKDGPAIESAASVLVLGAAASATSSPVYAKERRVAAVSVEKVKAITIRLQKCVLSLDNVSLQAASEHLGLRGEYEATFFVFVAENARLRGRIEELERGGGCFTSGTPNNVGFTSRC